MCVFSAPRVPSAPSTSEVEQAQQRAAQEAADQERSRRAQAGGINLMNPETGFLGVRGGLNSLLGANY